MHKERDLRGCRPNGRDKRQHGVLSLPFFISRHFLLPYKNMDV